MGGRGMINLKKCDFGDNLVTEDGRSALFLGIATTSPLRYVCAIKCKGKNYMTMYYNAGGKVLDTSFSGCDIKYNLVE